MDVFLYQTDDGGEIDITDGVVTLSPGLETAAYLSLFGGNEDDDGRKDSSRQYWGNLSETESAAQYRSETQHLLRSIPATSGNLKRLEDAAARDLLWFTAERIASAVTVAVALVGINRVSFTITIEAVGIESRFEFVENWKAST